MSFELSGPPGYLRISDPSHTLRMQTDTIVEHQKYWAEAYDTSVSEIDLGKHDINAIFLEIFNELPSLRPKPESREKIRQYVCGLLATSGLARRLLAHPDFKVKDPHVDNAADKKAPDVLFDTHDVVTFFHMTPEVCTLILPESENTDQWYKDGDLFVRRAMPAEFSPLQQQQLKDLHKRANPADMVTLYPYLGRS